MIRRIYLAADHAGHELKEKIKRELILQSSQLKIDVEDLGPYSTDSVDYPDYADLVCRRIHGFQLVSDQSEGQPPPPAEVGILTCGSGQGMAMRANKFPHIRAALCWNLETAKLCREHNDANVLCLGSRLLDHELALQMVNVFLTTPFLGGRHLRRIMKVSRNPDDKT
jgi:ribose 5-phosphate isomerase B